MVPLLVRQPASPGVSRPQARWRRVQVSLLAACALLQGLTLLTTAGARLDTTLGASASRLAQIVAGQIVCRSSWDAIVSTRSASPGKVTALAVLITVVAALLCIYALLRGPRGCVFIFFALLVLAAALTFPSVEPVDYKWGMSWFPDWECAIGTSPSLR